MPKISLAGLEKWLNNIVSDMKGIQRKLEKLGTKSQRKQAGRKAKSVRRGAKKFKKCVRRGCQNKVYAKGLCVNHYQKMWREAKLKAKK